MTYSADFRRKVLEVRDRDGLSFEQTAALFGVAKSSVRRWTERPEPRRKRNKPATKIDMDLLAQHVELYPDAYQYERAERFGCSQRGIGEALKRLGAGRKKKLFGIRKRMKPNEMPSAAELRDIMRMKGRWCILMKADSLRICRGLTVTRLSVNGAPVYMVGGPGGVRMPSELCTEPGC